jgi:hypothetical protein
MKPESGSAGSHLSLHSLITSSKGHTFFLKKVDTACNISFIVASVRYHGNEIKPLHRNGRLPNITHEGDTHTS